MAGSTKDVAFKYVVVGLLICVHYVNSARRRTSPSSLRYCVNCGYSAGKFRLIEQSALCTIKKEKEWQGFEIEFGIQIASNP